MIVKSNEAQWHITEGGSQLHNNGFIKKLGTFGECPEIKNVLEGTFEFPINTSVDTRYFINACIHT